METSPAHPVGQTTGMTSGHRCECLNHATIPGAESIRATMMLHERMLPAGGNIGIEPTSPSATLDVNGAMMTECVTVSTLPTGKKGMRHCVSDATSSTFLGSLTGSGATFCPVVYNGSAWVGG